LCMVIYNTQIRPVQRQFIRDISFDLVTPLKMIGIPRLFEERFQGLKATQTFETQPFLHNGGFPVALLSLSFSEINQKITLDGDEIVPIIPLPVLIKNVEVQLAFFPRSFRLPVAKSDPHTFPQDVEVAPGAIVFCPF